jgi:hypothetical protein
MLSFLTLDSWHVRKKQDSVDRCVIEQVKRQDDGKFGAKWRLSHRIEPGDWNVPLVQVGKLASGRRSYTQHAKVHYHHVDGVSQKSKYA